IRDFHVTGVQTCALPIYVMRLPVRWPDVVGSCFASPAPSHWCESWSRATTKPRFVSMPRRWREWSRKPVHDGNGGVGESIYLIRLPVFKLLGKICAHFDRRGKACVDHW